MRRCLIFGAGDSCTRNRITEIRDGDLVIAADGGYAWTQQEAIPVQIVMGDMDSLTSIAPPEKCMRFPVEKDDTDMGLAVEEGRRFGCKEYYLYGGTGGRADHTMANYQLLVSLARNGERGYLVDNRMTATAITSGTIRICGKEGAVLSVFSVDNESTGVTLAGLKYSIREATLTNSHALGVSNAFTAETAVIEVKKGTLLIIGEYLPSDVQ